jgi:parallel beta-helix repeat protein
VWVDNELVSYQTLTGNSMNNLVRGVMGTAPVMHFSGASVTQAQFLYAKIVSVSGKTVTLDTPSSSTLRYANMYVGIVNPAITGLVLDGNKPAGGTTTIPSVVEYSLARSASITNNTITKGAHGGVMLNRGTSDSSITGNVLSDNGDPAHSTGAAIWLYQGAMRNVVQNNQIDGDSYSGVIVDNRTTNSSEWDGASNNNTITQNVVHLPALSWNSGIQVEDSIGNTIRDNTVSSPFYGVSVSGSFQGTTPPKAANNLVDANDLTGDQTGLLAGGVTNTFQYNSIVNAAKAIAYTGTDNTYTGNTTG